MHLIPIRRLTLRSPLSRKEIIQRIQEQTEAPKTFRFGYNFEKGYEGTVQQDAFRIRRLIKYRNSFQPVIRGEFATTSEQSDLQITMTFHKLVIAFTVGWVVLMLVLFVITYAQAMRSAEGFEAYLLLPPLFILTFYAIMLLAFNNEANRSIRDLQKYLSAQIIE